MPAESRSHSRQFTPPLAAIAAGALVTVLVALGIARFTSPPASLGWQMYNDHSFATYSIGPEAHFLEKPDSDWLAIYEGIATGFRSLDLRCYDAEQVTPNSYPPHLRRRLIVDVGFPAHALRTESPAIARRFAIDHAEPEPDHRIASPPESLPYRPLWRGFMVNTLLAATLLLALYVFISRRRCCYARPVVVIGACAGLWLSIASGWTAYWFHSRSNILDVYAQGPSEYESKVAPVVHPAEGVPWDSFEGTVARRFGSRVEQYHFGTIAVRDDGVRYYETTPVRDFRHRLGWPFFCFDTRERTTWGPPPGVTTGAMFRIPVSWPGLFANWTFYSAMLLAMLLGPPWFRRRHRLRRKCCPHCGYPWGVSPVCTECGTPLPEWERRLREN